MADSMTIADYVIYITNKILREDNKGNKFKFPMSNLYLQKILYFLNVIHLINNNLKDGLISDEPFEKWEYGPVLPNVYEEYSRFGGNPITSPVQHVTYFHIDKSGNLDLKQSKKGYYKRVLNDTDKSFILKHIESLLRFSPFELVNYSHKEPQWEKWRNTDGRYNVTYNNEDTIKYYDGNKNRRFWEF